MAAPSERPRAVRCGYERKFVVAAEATNDLLHALDRLLARDPMADADGGYAVHSLYFDTPDHAVYHRTPGRGDAKLRLRRYGDHGAVYLERKAKGTDGRIDKVRTQIAPTEIARLADPDADWDGAWFARLLADGRFAPSRRVSYRRIAWDGAIDRRPVRVTLDRQIHACPADRIAVPEPVNGGLLLSEAPVVEMKHDGPFPEVLTRLVRDARLSEASFSKYRRAMEAG